MFAISQTHLWQCSNCKSTQNIFLRYTSILFVMSKNCYVATFIARCCGYCPSSDVTENYEFILSDTLLLVKDQSGVDPFSMRPFKCLCELHIPGWDVTRSMWTVWSSPLPRTRRRCHSTWWPEALSMPRPPQGSPPAGTPLPGPPGSHRSKS